MSVLSFPRIYFNGFISWDPCTFNNNDFEPTYAAAQAALNWPFLSSAPGLTAIGATTISPENFRETFRPWGITLQNSIGSPACEWNMFGTHAVNFVQYQNRVSLVTGGATGPTGPSSMITDDPFVGATVGLTGNNAPAVMVDNNPVASWSTQVYWGELSFGNGDAALRLPMNYRMFLRWVYMGRQAGCFQTAVPYDQVIWPKSATASPLVDSLQAAAKQAKGIMVRFTAYNLLFNQNGVFNDIPVQPRNTAEYVQALSSAWQQWNDNQSTTGFFSNPAITHVVGTIGVWNEGELASAPGGRYFVAQNPVAPAATGSTGLPQSTGDGNDTSVPTGIRMPESMLVAAAASAPTPVSLGPAVAEINGNRISLDFSSTIPEVPPTLTKANFGPLSLGVLTSGGLIQELAVIDYAHYGQTAYQTTSGIIDLPLWASGPFEGPLVISAGDNIVLQESIFDAQTDSRGIYLDQGGATAIDVNVYQRGEPSPNAKVLVARYGLGVQSPAANQTLPLVAAGPTAATATYTSNVQVVNFTTGAQSTITVTGLTSTVSTQVTVLDSDSDGVAQLGLTAQAPGFVALAFFPYGPTGATPTPPLSLATPNTSPITYADYTTVRVLPFDDNVPQLFVDFWNGLTGPTADKREKAWDFIYNPTLPDATIPSGGGILYLYDQLFNVMLQHVDLGSLTAVEASLGPIWNRIAPSSAAEGSGNMPITRDMSAGKRTTLQLWIYLAANNYNVPALSLTAIDGWSPPAPGPRLTRH